MMNPNHQIQHTTPEIAPTFKQFFDRALPKDGDVHTLTFGELHNTSEHLHWLRQHLSALKNTYGITSIGIERSTDLNPLFWAYQDGTLEKQL